MTGSDLQDILIKTLMRDTGRDRRHWRIVVGAVKVYSISTHPHCNWSVTPAGSYGDIDAVEQTVDILRGRYPILAPE